MAERLADHTTLRLGGPASRFVTARTDDELVAAVRAADESGEPLLVLGGGSNLVVADEGFAGTVVRVATRGISPDVEGEDAVSCGGVLVTVAAGEGWDDLVARAVASGWIGVEALAGIPGSVGATPIQNVGAYGQEVAQTIASVRVWDRTLRGVRTFANADCGFGYRHSRFKADPQRHVVLSVTFQFRQGSLGAPVEYAELARTLGVSPGQRAPLEEVRTAVLGLRAGNLFVEQTARNELEHLCFTRCQGAQEFAYALTLGIMDAGRGIFRQCFAQRLHERDSRHGFRQKTHGSAAHALDRGGHVATPRDEDDGAHATLR